MSSVGPGESTTLGCESSSSEPSSFCHTDQYFFDSSTHASEKEVHLKEILYRMGYELSMTLVPAIDG